MSAGKKRGRQQQIDDKALAILRYKMPEGFVFREQEKDFGIDCELEHFQEVESGQGSLQASTGVIFKAQVKGVEDGARLELATKPVLSKGFEVRDLVVFSPSDCDSRTAVNRRRSADFYRFQCPAPDLPGRCDPA